MMDAMQSTFLLGLLLFFDMLYILCLIVKRMGVGE